MSVLEDTNTENGLAIHNLSLALGTSVAERYMQATAKHDFYRLLGIEYCQSITEFPVEAIYLANHHWVSDAGYCWGTPHGKYSDLIKRLLSYSSDWCDGRWLPNLKLETTEQRARDLLAASYLFKLRMGKSETVAEFGLLPLLENGHKILSSSKAVATLLCLEIL
jgi:hypothetical protein